ncbi:hypothetical protein BSLA_01f0896 [Burkholderia stabilis]|nr:hypothetical protein BSLA_01f0896 [Burkholderia stabilis]
MPASDRATRLRRRGFPTFGAIRSAAHSSRTRACVTEPRVRGDVDSGPGSQSKGRAF